MIANRWQRTIAALCAVSLLLTACTSLQPVPIPSGESPPSLPGVKVGDNVVVNTKAGERKKFAVTAVEADALVGEGVRIAYADMERLRVKQFLKVETTVLAVVGVYAAVLIYSASQAFDE